MLGLGTCTTIAQAQTFDPNSVIPAADGTGTQIQTQINSSQQQFDITGGTASRDGQNLFHSFDRLNLNSNQTANFIVNPAIQNIFARVKGEMSIIDGLLQV
ncbi:MAG: hypothetical protein VKJ24_18595, partial [Synechococcales bacterium]|nr:hypothetical protein [Synechococcales bacterium]